MLLCPSASHPAELWWSPEASQGLQTPGLTTFPHLLCATPPKHIRHFAPAAPSTRETPSPAPPHPPKRVSQYLPLRYQKVATARVPRRSAARWWSLNKRPDELTPNVLGSLQAAAAQTTATFKQALGTGEAQFPASHQPSPAGSTQGDISQSKLSVLGVYPKYEPGRTGRRWKGQREGKKANPQALLLHPSHEFSEFPVVRSRGRGFFLDGMIPCSHLLLSPRRRTKTTVSLHSHLSRKGETDQKLLTPHSWEGAPGTGQSTLQGAVASQTKKLLRVFSSSLGLSCPHPQAPGGTESQNHRIIEWFGLEGTLKIIWFQPPCHEQGHLPLDQVAQNHCSWTH